MKYCNEKVSETVKLFQEDVSTIFGQRVMSIVIYGSAIRGDFLEGKSDIDFVVFLSGKITNLEMLELNKYHHNLREKPSCLMQYLEGRYIGLDKNCHIVNGYYVGTNQIGWKEITELGFGAVESAMIIDAYDESAESPVLEKVLSVDWKNVEIEIIRTINDFIEHPVDDIGWIAYALITSIRSLYSIKKVGFISKRAAVEWIMTFSDYSKYTRINELLVQYLDHFTKEDKERTRKSDFILYKTYLIQMRDEIYQGI